MESVQQNSFQPRRNLPPAEIDCRWWKKGNCTRGSTCFFRHDPRQAGVDSPEQRAKAASSSRKSGDDTKKTAAESSGSAAQATGTQCAICFEVPEKYGLLINCDHVFCLECIRSWRTSAKNTSQNDPLDPLSENYSTLKKASKTCPMCRVQSDYVVPSTVFPTPPPSDSSSKDNSNRPESSTTPQTRAGENPAKDEIVNTYLSRLKKIPCRYFEQSVQRKRDGARNAKLSCGFGNNCHYAHTDPTTQEPYIFSPEELHSMKAGQARKQRRARDMMAQREMAMLVSGLAPLSLEDQSELDEEEYYAFAPAHEEPDYEALSEFFGPSPFIYNMMNRGYGPVFAEDTEWETETDDEEEDFAVF